jgi:CheY-like chemotaxis protein
MYKVLLIDDERAILSLLTDVLEMDEFAVTTASSAHEGIARLAEQGFDLVVTDLRMESPMAGFEAVGATRGLVPRPVTVLLTAFPVPTDEWQRAGADALFVKGADSLALPQRLKLLLEQNAQPARSRPRCIAVAR